MAVEIYGAEWCTWCNKAKEVALAYGLAVIYSDIDKFSHFKPQLKERIEKEGIQLTNGKLTIPQIWWDGRYVGGYDTFATEIENLGNYGQGPC